MAPLLIGAWAGCSPKPAAYDEAATMQAGLEALQTRHDPGAAKGTTRPRPSCSSERSSSAIRPTTGATFQLAAALDAAGKPAEARPLWEKMLRMAEAVQDRETADRARARLKENP